MVRRSLMEPIDDLPPNLLEKDTSPEAVRRFIDSSLQEATRQGRRPRWRLPEARSDETPDLALRRAIALLLLGLPGSATYDEAYERSLCGAHSRADDLQWTDEVSRAYRENTKRVASGVFDREDAGWRDGRWQDGVLVVETADSHLFITNLSKTPAYVPDGRIIAASDDPNGLLCLTSDNDYLPARVALCLALK